MEIPIHEMHKLQVPLLPLLPPRARHYCRMRGQGCCTASHNKANRAKQRSMHAETARQCTIRQPGAMGQGHRKMCKKVL